MRELRAEVDGRLAVLERVEVLREGLPLPVDAFGERGAGNVFDAFHQLDQPLFLAGRTGAKPTPQLPITTVVTPWPPEGSSRSSQVT